MNEHYENIKNKTVCPDCASKEMGIGYLYEGSGAVKKQTKVLGMQAYQGTGNLLLIICKSCGLVAKSYAIGR